MKHHILCIYKENAEQNNTFMPSARVWYFSKKLCYLKIIIITNAINEKKLRKLIQRTINHMLQANPSTRHPYLYTRHSFQLRKSTHLDLIVPVLLGSCSTLPIYSSSISRFHSPAPSILLLAELSLCSSR